MTKAAFLCELDSKLSLLPRDDREKSLEYYSELIDDRMEDGLSEAEAVATLGSVEEIYRETIADIPFQDLIKRKLKPKKSIGVFGYILIFFGFLVFGLPILASVFSVTVSLYAALWAVVISFYAATLALLIGGVAGVIVFFPTVFAGATVKALFLLGAGIFSLGLVFPFFILSKKLTKFVIFLGKWLIIGTKKLLIK